MADLPNKIAVNAFADSQSSALTQEPIPTIETYTSQGYCSYENVSTFALGTTNRKQNNKILTIKNSIIMKALFVIAVSIAAALILKFVEYVSSKRNMKSVGAKSNKASRNIPMVDVTDEKELKNALDFYKDLAD